MLSIFKKKKSKLKIKNCQLKLLFRYAEIASQYNAYMDADACCIGGYQNAAFWHHFKVALPLIQKGFRARGYETHASGNTVPARRYYVMMAGDYDSAAWTATDLPQRWNDAKRGSIPITWSINPATFARAPMALAHYWKTATDNDVFAAEEGPGYSNPDALLRVTPGVRTSRADGLKLWSDAGRAWYSMLDESFTAYAINGNYGPPIEDDALRSFTQFSWDGVVVHAMPQPSRLIDNTPVIPGKSLRDGNAASVADIRAHFGGSASSAPSKAQFAVFRTVRKSPTYLESLVNAVTAADPFATLVDGVTLGYLARASLGGNNVNRITYMEDNVSSLRVLSPGTFTLDVTIRNDAIGQNLSPSSFFLLVQFVDATTRATLSNQGVPLQSSATRNQNTTARGAVTVDAGWLNRRVILRYDLSYRGGPALPFSSLGNIPRAYSLLVAHAAPSCSSDEGVAGGPTATIMPIELQTIAEPSSIVYYQVSMASSVYSFSFAVLLVCLLLTQV